MSTQTFSKVFLFPNNKEKPKTFFLLLLGRPMGTTGPWPLLACVIERRERRRPDWGHRLKADLAQQGRGETATPRRRSRRHGGTAAASGPTAVAGHDRASRRARWVCKKMANPSRQLNGMEKGRRKRFHGEAKHGGAMTDGGENTQGRYTLLKWCPCSEH